MDSILFVLVGVILGVGLVWLFLRDKAGQAFNQAKSEAAAGNCKPD